MKIKVWQSEARLFGRAGESVTRSDRRERELEFESSFPPLTARPNRRREDVRGLATQSSPLGGAPNQHGNDGKTLTPVGHPFMTPSERRFAPTTVRQARNGVRYGLEQVSAFIGIRSQVKDSGFCIIFPSFLPISWHTEACDDNTAGLAHLPLPMAADLYRCLMEGIPRV